MTTENTAEVVCEDGETRPLDVCRQDDDGNWHPADEVVNLPDGRDLSIHHPDVVELYDGSYDYRDDCIQVGSAWYTDYDAVRCDSCRRGVFRDDSYTDPDGEPMCVRCFENNCVLCSNCGDAQWADSNDLDDDGHCEGCAAPPPPRLISCYSDRSANHMRSETQDKLRFGVELEVEGCESDTQAAEYIRRFLPDTYCTLKRDGSLGESGVEIVTRPDSMAVHKRMFGVMFDDSPGRAMTSWNTGRCGMHVHISRAALSQLQIGKMLCFLNEPSALNFITKVAGRRPCSWCKVYKKKLSDCRHDSDRYTALNVTNKNTVEIRIFKGTLNEAGFYKNLEFVQALVEFTAPGSRSIAQATSYRAFCDWLSKKTYPHLYAFLASKGFVRRRHAA